MPYEGLLGLKLILGRDLLLQGVAGLLYPILKLAVFLLLVNLLEIFTLHLLLQPGHSSFLTFKLPLGLLNLLLSLCYLAQMPLNDLHSVFTYLSIFCDASESARFKMV